MTDVKDDPLSAERVRETAAWIDVQLFAVRELARVAGPHSRQAAAIPTWETLAALAGAHGAPTPRPLAEWHEDIGPVLWWRFPVDEPPHAGTPLDSDWPGHHTHWTPIPVPKPPEPAK